MKQQATSNKQHHLSISFIFFLFLIFTSFAQHQEEYELSCGTEVNPDDLVYDVSYGNNQKLLDIILEENIAVPEGYYEYLGIENPVERYRAAAEPGKKYVPIKLWVYRNNDGTGNINT